MAITDLERMIRRIHVAAHHGHVITGCAMCASLRERLARRIEAFES